MKKFSIIADGNCDLSSAFRIEYDIRVVQGHLVLPGDRDVPAFLEWGEYDRDEFYEDLRKNPNDYATSPPNVAEYALAMEEEVRQGKDVLVMTISASISGSYSFAKAAADSIMQKYAGSKVVCVDTMRFGPAFGLMAVLAARLRLKGCSLDETVTWLSENKNRFHQAGWLDDLSFVAKKGRISQPKAWLGTLAGVKPIGEFDHSGLTTVIGKVKGQRLAYEVLLGYIQATIENPSEQTIFIAHTSRYPQAVAYRDMIIERFKPQGVYINDVFPSCGINIGPGLMAAYYMGRPISEDLEQEKALFKQLVSEKSL